MAFPDPAVLVSYSRLLLHKIRIVKSLYLLIIVLFSGIIVNAQTDMNAQTGVKGTVITTDGKPGAYVNVVLKEINKATMTDEEGWFVITNVKPGNYTLQVSHTG